MSIADLRIPSLPPIIHPLPSQRLCDCLDLAGDHPTCEVEPAVVFKVGSIKQSQLYLTSRAMVV